MGPTKPDGSINWNCPCMKGQVDGPCGEEFKAAYSCFHYSEAEPKGSDCYPQFKEMTECWLKYPEFYGKDIVKNKDDENDEEIRHKETDNNSNLDLLHTEDSGKNKSKEVNSEMDVQSNSDSSSSSNQGSSS